MAEKRKEAAGLFLSGFLLVFLWLFGCSIVLLVNFWCFVCVLCLLFGVFWIELVSRKKKNPLGNFEGFFNDLLFGVCPISEPFPL